FKMEILNAIPARHQTYVHRYMTQRKSIKLLQIYWLIQFKSTLATLMSLLSTSSSHRFNIGLDTELEGQEGPKGQISVYLLKLEIWHHVVVGATSSSIGGSNTSFEGRDGGRGRRSASSFGGRSSFGGGRDGGSTSAKQLADVGSMWEGQNTSATCAMIWSKISQLLMMLRVGCEDGLMEANAREQAREREWQQRNIDINSVLKKFTDSRSPLFR
ncbi:hypothetical protein Tco_1032004, partial [Tanacetum coccineum]